MPITRRRALQWSIAMVVSGRALAESTQRRLVMAYNDDYAPYSFADEKQNLVGILPDAIQRLLTDVPGLKLQQDGYPWRRVQAMVREGGADGMCTFASEERLRFAFANRMPIVTLRPHLFFSAFAPNRGQIEAVRTREDLAHLRVLDLKGNNWAEQNLRDLPNLELLQDFNTVFRLIRAGRGDVHVSLSPVVTQWRLQRLGIPQHEILTMPAPFVASEVPFHVLIRQSHPHAREILAALDEKLTTRGGSELVEQLTRKYLT